MRFPFPDISSRPVSQATEPRVSVGLAGQRRDQPPPLSGGKGISRRLGSQLHS